MKQGEKEMDTILFWFAASQQDNHLFALYNGSDTIVTASRFLDRQNIEKCKKIDMRDIEEYFPHFGWTYQCFDDSDPCFYSCPKSVGGYKFQFPLYKKILEIKCFHFPFSLRKLPLVKEGACVTWIPKDIDIYISSSSFIHYYDKIKSASEVLSLQK